MVIETVMVSTGDDDGNCDCNGNRDGDGKWQYLC